jgi:hypothetical protein
MKAEKEIQQRIEEVYLHYNFNEGWRFLNCYQKNLKRNNGIMILTLNPASRKSIDYENEVRFSYESGFSNLAERAISEVSPQLKKFLKNVHSQIHTAISIEKFINDVLVGYFIPIRSSSFKNLKNRKELITLGKELWTPILKANLDSLQLLAVIDKVTMKAVIEIFLIIGLIEIESKGMKLETGWGNYTADIKRFKFNDKTITLLRLPHLSRFKIFGREKSKDEINKMVKESVRYFTSN